MSRFSVILAVFLLSIGVSLTACEDRKEGAPAQTEKVAPAVESKVEIEEKAEPSGPEEAVSPPVLTSFVQELAVVGEAPKRASAGAAIPLEVSVKNPSGEVWSAKGVSEEDVRNRVRLGAYWLSAKGEEMPQSADALLAEDLKPGESVKLAFEIKAPDAKGVYILHVSMVQEAVAWFSAKGAKSLDIPMMIE